MTIKVSTFLISVILLFSLLVRFYHLEYPLIHTSKWGDGTRDYLVAHYIRTGERPMLGPFNLLNESGIRNSPLYYYILALFLIVKDEVMTLSIINIFLQNLTIFLIYLIAKTTFGNKTALLSAILFSVTPEVIRHTEFIWQPNLMQPFAYLSLLLLILAYLKKSYKLLVLSWIVTPVAFVIHNSFFAWLPLFLLITLLILRLQKKSVKYYLGVFLASLTVLIYYLPPFVYFLTNYEPVSIESTSIYIYSFDNFIQNFQSKLIEILQVFSLDPRLALPLLVMLVIYFKNQKLDKKIYMTLGLSLFLSPIFFASLFNKNQIHYLILSIGTFTIIFAEVVLTLLKSLLKKIRLDLVVFAQILIALILTLVFSANFEFVYKKKTHPEDLQLITSSSRAIEQRLSAIAKDENRLSPDFFQIASYANRGQTFRYPTLDTIFLVLLEKSLNFKLASTSDESIYNLVQTNSLDYIFIACIEFESEVVRDCSEKFFQDYPNYAIMETIYNKYPLIIYLAGRS